MQEIFLMHLHLSMILLVNRQDWNLSIQWALYIYRKFFPKKISYCRKFNYVFRIRNFPISGL